MTVMNEGGYSMKLYSIMPLLEGRVREICDNIEEQYRDGVANEALFIMSLHPEGDPTSDKASLLCEKYDAYAKELATRGLSCGILAQSTIGHGPGAMAKAPMQHLVGLLDGKEQHSVCPYDEGFRAYIRDAMSTLTRRHPTTLMVDDDFRLFSRSYRGCACPLHMKEINRRAGTSYTREELTALLNTDTDESRRMAEIFYDTQIDSLVGAARAMREGIDAVDPRQQGAFCVCGDTVEGVDQIAKILAGEGNPVIVRVNNARYTAPGPRGYSKAISRAATQMAALEGVADAFLAETDTCPQNRYSTSAAALHTHFTLTILEGVAGCKHWITRTQAFEPQSGQAYRKKLSQYKGFYEALFAIVPDMEWLGCRIPLPSAPIRPKPPICDFKFPSGDIAWATCVMESLGLPLYFSKKTGGAVLLDGDRDVYFSDDEIREMLRGTVLLSSLSAEHLIARGFGDLLGVNVRPLTDADLTPRGERVYVNGERIQKQQHLMYLSPNKPETAAHSEIFALENGTDYKPLFPGVTSYQNALGGTVIVFAGRPLANFTYHEAFSFLCESRKRQLIALLGKEGHLPVYYPDDAEVSLKVGRHRDGRLLCSFTNIGLDRLDEIILHTERPIKTVQRLTPDGKFAHVPFSTNENGDTVIGTPADILTPVILMLTEA